MKRGRTLSLIVLVAILAAGTYYIATRHERFAVILRVPLSGVVALLALTVLGRAVEAHVLRLTARELGARIGVLESNLLAWTVLYWNYLPMRPGTGALAVYMKRKRGLLYSRFVAYLLGVNLMAMLSRGLLGLAVTAPICAAGGLTVLIPGAFAAMAAASIGVMLVPTGWHYEGDRWLLRALSQAGRAWHELRRRRGLLLRIGLWKALHIGVAWARFYLCFRFVGVAVAPAGTLVMALLGPVTAAVGIVPGAIGVREALIGGVT
ncbi:MAG: lysylphosphatidylglycerol synthase domain-containing protein, partial [Planctomycetota bacterium]